MQNELQKPYHHGELREALLAAGEAALQDLPLGSVSLREIARRAGVSHAGPKHHFSTLGALLGEIAARGFERFVEALEIAAAHNPDQTASGRMQAMARAYVRFATAQPAVYGLMFGKKEQVEITPHLSEAMFAAWKQLEDQVQAIVGQRNAAKGAMFVWSLVHGMAMLANDRRMPPQIDPHATIEGMIRMMIAGLEADA